MQKTETAALKITLAKQRVAELSNLEQRLSATGEVVVKCTTNTSETSNGIAADISFMIGD